MKVQQKRNVNLFVNKLKIFIDKINKEGVVVTPNHMASLYECLETGRCNTSVAVFKNGRFKFEKCNTPNCAAYIVDQQSSKNTCVQLNDIDLYTYISKQQLYNIMWPNIHL